MKRRVPARFVSLMILLVLLFLPLASFSTIGKGFYIPKSEIVGWSDDILLSDQDDNWSMSPVIGIADNIAHIIWYDCRNGSLDLYYKKSFDYGKNWENSIKLANGLSPAIAVNNSSVHVVREVGMSEVYYKRSLDNGDNWGSDILLSDNDGYMSYQPKIAASGENVHVVWREEKDYGGYPAVIV